jgi:hypothetical protein
LARRRAADLDAGQGQASRRGVSIPHQVKRRSRLIFGFLRNGCQDSRPDHFRLSGAGVSL